MAESTENNTSSQTPANSTLAANSAVVNTAAAAQPAQTAQTTAGDPSVPCALVAGSPEHKKLTSSRKSEDRNNAYARMEKKAAKNGGNYTLIDSNTGEKLTMPMADVKNLIETNNANGIPMNVNGAGKWGGTFLFQPTGKPQPVATLAAVPQQPVEPVASTENDNGGIWNWLKRNWYWVAAGLGAVAAGIIYLVHRNRKKSKSYAIVDPDKPVDPGDNKPGNDDPGNDKPGNDNPGGDKPGNDNPSNDIPDVGDSNLGQKPGDGPSGGNGSDGPSGGNGGDGPSGGNGGDGPSGGNGGDGPSGGNGGDGPSGGNGGNSGNDTPSGGNGGGDVGDSGLGSGNSGSYDSHDGLVSGGDQVGMSGALDQSGSKFDNNQELNDAKDEAFGNIFGGR